MRHSKIKTHGNISIIGYTYDIISLIERLFCPLAHCVRGLDGYHVGEKTYKMDYVPLNIFFCALLLYCVAQIESAYCMFSRIGVCQRGFFGALR
jgi:hypothetical protein